MKKLLTIVALMTSVSACSMFESKGDEIIFDKVLGPRTEAQLKKLPGDLRGDQAGQNLSYEELKAKELEKDGK